MHISNKIKKHISATKHYWIVKLMSQIIKFNGRDGGIFRIVSINYDVAFYESS